MFASRFRPRSSRSHSAPPIETPGRSSAVQKAPVGTLEEGKNLNRFFDFLDPHSETMRHREPSQFPRRHNRQARNDFPNFMRQIVQSIDRGAKTNRYFR
jgi:hypothetical protein